MKWWNKNKIKTKIKGNKNKNWKLNLKDIKRTKWLNK